MSLSRRLALIHRELADLIAEHAPDEGAVEETFVNRDPRSALKLGQARGVALAALALAGLHVAEYAANLVKKTVVGVGHAEKPQVAMMVKMLLPTSKRAAPTPPTRWRWRSATRSTAARGQGRGVIGKLEGPASTVLDADGLILDVGGVGYLVAASARTLRGLPGVGEAVSLHIETQVREDAIRLFGFLTEAERDWFRLLQGVQGVGAKVALGILGALPGDALAQAIARQDKAMMARAPGVGPKLAARLVLELKDKAPAWRRWFRDACAGAGVDAEGRRGRGAGSDRPRLWAPAGDRSGRQGAESARRGGGHGGPDPRRAEGTRAMSAPEPAPSAEPRRRFFLPMLGLVLLFLVLGPAVGGAVFVPLAMLAEAETQAATHMGWIAGLIGHAVVLIPAYLLGALPAAAAGLAFALYDAWAPPGAPRALGAALIGAVFAHLLYLLLLSAGGAVGGWIEGEFSGAGEVVTEWTAGEFDASLYHALIASGAIAAFACAAAAGLLGLTTRP